MNPAQREAVTFDKPGPVLVLAGPGSGKTHVITHRVRFLTERSGISPEEILVITFTREAALSMRNRFLTLPNASNAVNFGTFHSVFYQILKLSTGLKDRQILKDQEKRKILHPILCRHIPNITNNESYNLCPDVLSAISFMKNTGQKQKAMLFLPESVREIYPVLAVEYETKRKELGKLDFDDMLNDCRCLLQSNRDIRQYWQKRFPYILIDEFQDINPVQYEIVKLLTAKPYSVFAVGDDDQSIYSFRGAAPDCMQRFAEEFHAKKIVLKMNYRSFPDIVDAAGKVIRENRNRFEKELVSFKGTPTGKTQQKDDAACVRIQGFESRQEENGYLVEKLRKDLKRNDTGTVGVLFRTNRLMQRFALCLRQNKLSYTMREKGKSPYQEETVQDILSYLSLGLIMASDHKIIFEEAHWTMFCRIINKPLRYVSREVLGECYEALKKNVEEDIITRLKTLYESRQMGSEKEKLLLRLELMKKQLSTIGSLSSFPAIQYIRRVIGYDNWIFSSYEKDEGRREQVTEILDWLSEDAACHPDQAQWLDFIKNASDQTMPCKQKGPEEQRILLMTVHGAKGLEFDSVYMPDCNERIYPYGNLQDSAQLEEERRIFYVGMTRAKSSLELLYVAGTREHPQLPSRFLKELW